ncbi:MAG: DoxX family protein [Ilumatobacteraceae bacterium]|nr:DoxX family protein [Ilumatobacteraceae bacterium]
MSVTKCSRGLHDPTPGNRRPVGGGVIRRRIGYPTCMFGPRTLIRPLLASAFIAGGIQTLRSPKAVVPAAEEVGVPIAEVVGLPTDAEKLVMINAGVQVGAGALLALGFFPRVASVALAASLVPTTIAGHPFWKEKDPQQRAQQRMQAMKNATMLGGLLTAALDTGGRPSVFWASRRAAGKAAGSISSTAQSVAETVGNALQSLPH